MHFVKDAIRTCKTRQCVLLDAILTQHGEGGQMDAMVSTQQRFVELWDDVSCLMWSHSLNFFTLFIWALPHKTINRV